MKILDRLKRAVRNPRLFARGFNRAYHRRGGLRKYNSSGIDVFDEDWDNLIVLDACRYDMFEEVSKLDGFLTSKLSKGSSTTEWLKANFDGRTLNNTVYVTANPQLERNRERWDISLHKTVNVWLDEGWDEKTGTVLAETMTQAGKDAYHQFANKRLIVHYMQPHYPFVRSNTAFDKKHLKIIDDDNSIPEGENVWNQKMDGKLSIPREELRHMYIDNLKYVLKDVDGLLNEISGKTVITSDHGNYVGERASPIPIKEYGHPRGLYDDSVVKVPWLEVEKGERREISIDEPTRKANQIETEEIEQRLEHLGYKG